MPADNWRECPNCDANKSQKENDMLNLLQKDYGKISIENYDERTKALKEFMRQELDCTLREDYEYNLDTTAGELGIYYKCHCYECGFGFTYTEDVDYGSLVR